KYWELYDRSKIHPAANADRPGGAPEIAFHDGREIRRSFKSRPGGTPTREDAVALRHGYFANTSYMDAQLGKVIDELDRLDLAKNTIIVMWSDHGFHLGENGLWAKTSNFELDARVPLIIATPDHAGGQRSPSLAELLDLYPTVVELCGLDPPGHLEGKSLVPILRNPTTKVKDAAYTWHPRPAYPPNGENPTVMGYSMRTENYRFTEWRKFETNEIVATEIYDHRHDPAETNNLASRSPKALKAQLAKLLARSLLNQE
ncbi:MAG: sulfatase-like hydrolase/transferase, partial [Verrucomicrobiales bacterium]